MMTHTDTDTAPDASDIRTLRREALDHGDLAQAAICDLAVGDIPDVEWDMLSGRDVARIGAMTREQALAACARAISAARAQR